MQFNRNILIPIVAVTIGCILGAAIATGVCWWEFARTSESHLQLEVFERVRILRQLRTSKNKEAIEEQEILLDGSVLGLGSLIEMTKGNHDVAKEALQRAVNYRKQFPRSTYSPEGDLATAYALSLSKP